MSCVSRSSGLASGPTKFIIVGIPRAWRAGPMKRMAGCMVWAKIKAKPTSSSALDRVSGDAATLIPRASRTSAEPDLEEIERFPALAIRIPPAAKTKQTVVEMLKL